MALLTPFTYRKGESLLHRLDVRCKFFMMCLLSMAMVSAHFFAGCVYGLILFFFVNACNLKILTTLNQIKYFMLLLVFIVFTRALTVQGDILFSFYGLSITFQGLEEGILLALKFFLVMITGLLFCVTTKPSAVKNAVQWFLKPIPFIPEKRVAIMISLAMSFMPVILNQAREISEAQKARCGDLEKNPVKKITRLVIPLLKKTFLSADHLVLAMESRCYSDDRTDPEFAPSGKEHYFLVGSVLISSSLVWL